MNGADGDASATADPPPRHIELDHITNCDVCGIKGMAGYDCPRPDCPADATAFRASV
jgi:hypothetical protein